MVLYLISIMLVEKSEKKNNPLGCTVFDIREGVLVENNRHFAEMTDSLFISR